MAPWLRSLPLDSPTRYRFAPGARKLTEVDPVEYRRLKLHRAQGFAPDLLDGHVFDDVARLAIDSRSVCRAAGRRDGAPPRRPRDHPGRWAPRSARRAEAHARCPLVNHSDRAAPAARAS